MSESERRDYRSLGEMIRDAREKRGWSVEQLSERSKIMPRLIEAIEADDLEQLSGPVYARGFVRTLSEILGLDTPWLLSKLEGYVGSAPKVEAPAPALPQSTRVRSSSGPVTPVPEEPEEEQTWRIDTVRVRRVETSGSAPTGKIVAGVGAVVVLLALAAAVWFFLLRGDGNGAGETSLGGAATGGSEVARYPTPALDRPEPPGSASTTAVEEDSFLARQPGRPAPAPAESVDGSGDGGAVGDTRETPDEIDGGDGASPQPTHEELVADPSVGRGLGSIVRRGDPDQVPLMELVILANRRVGVWAAADGKTRQRKILAEGQAWSLMGRDHFSLEFDDPEAVTLELDGVRRDPPPGLDGEWILYP